MRRRRYIMLGAHKTAGEIVGYCEFPLSMGFSKDHVKAWWPDSYEIRSKYFARLGKTIKEFSKAYPTYTWKLYRVNSAKCPVKIFDSPKSRKNQQFSLRTT